MSENKTKTTEASVADYLASITDVSRRGECEVLADLMARATNQPPRMWGSAIVGFGSHRYTYESGRKGESCLVGFSSRKGDITIYGLNAAVADGRLSELGKHKTGKGCLYIRKLDDVDLRVLEDLVAGVAAARTGVQG